MIMEPGHFLNGGLSVYSAYRYVVLILTFLVRVRLWRGSGTRLFAYAISGRTSWAVLVTVIEILVHIAYGP